MCQSVNLSWKIVAQTAACVFIYFCDETICGYKFVAPLKVFVQNFNFAV